MKLKGKIIEINQVTQPQKKEMFSILFTYFDHVSMHNFEKDLAEKNWVVLLSDNQDKIRGFSTQMLMDAAVEGAKIKVIFSGDTIIEKEFWGENILARVWLKHFTTIAASLKNTRMFWFLITMGYKTYRFLPVYFKEFYPNYSKPSPIFEKKVLDTVGASKFPAAYDPKTSIIRFKNQAESLKPGIAEIIPGRINNPHIKFFLEKNSGYQRGDELACLTELKPENYRSSVIKIIGKEEAFSG